jgi:hypothetical protein
MKFITTITLLIISYSSFSQITLSEVLDFYKISFKEMQSNLFKTNTIIDNKAVFKYIPVTNCNPNILKEDSCTWECSTPNYKNQIISKFQLFEVFLEDTLIVNYLLDATQESTFAENYNPTTKKANTFITIEEKTLSENSNCNNELEYFSVNKHIFIQFNNIENWNYFKNNVIDNAEFIGTDQTDDNSPIRLQYEMKIQSNNGEYIYLLISLTEKIHHILSRLLNHG